jgi:hypothetical protein
MTEVGKVTAGLVGELTEHGRRSQPVTLGTTRRCYDSQVDR